MTTSTDSPWLRVQGVGKSFPGVRVLHDVSLEIRAGEVHALIGQNGAGKSTLIKILAGVYRPDDGSVEIDGEEVRFDDAAQSTAAGIAVLYQEPQFVGDLPVFENIFLGISPPKAGPFLRRGAMRQRCRDLLARLGVELDVSQRTSDLSAAQAQMMSLARCLLLGVRLIIMDEPTASLGAHEVDQVYRTVEQLRADGLSVIYVSHRLDEISSLCDRATVLRDGELVARLSRDELSDRKRLVSLITGREPSQLVRATHHERGERALRASGLTWKKRVIDVDIELFRGEVTGVAGFVGSGRSELAHILFGALRPDAGRIEINDHAVAARSPRKAISNGVALLPEDRRHQGSFAEWTVRENLTVAALSSFARFGFIQRSRERSQYADFRQQLAIKAESCETRFSHLSGGNQQKVVIAKWLATEADILIFDEPTQGVDVGAQEEIHRLVRDIAHQGKAVMFISSDLAETLRVSDRLLVMREGHLVADRQSEDVRLEEVVAMCLGGVPA